MSSFFKKLGLAEKTTVIAKYAENHSNVYEFTVFIILESF